MSNKDELLQLIKQLPARDQQWLAGQLNKKETVPSDGIAESVYNEIRSRKGTTLTPWLSVPKTKKIEFIEAFNVASGELKDKGVDYPGKIIPTLVILGVDHITFDNIISGLKKVCTLFNEQFPDYNAEAIILLAKVMKNFDPRDPLPSNPLYDD